MKTKALAKLVRVRTRQRNRVAAHMRRATAEVGESVAAEQAAVDAVRSLASVDATEAHEVGRLENSAQYRAGATTRAHARAEKVRGELGRASMALRRAEILHQRARDELEARRRRIEQREQDEIASRRRNPK